MRCEVLRRKQLTEASSSRSQSQSRDASADEEPFRITADDGRHGKDESTERNDDVGEIQPAVHVLQADVQDEGRTGEAHEDTRPAQQPEVQHMRRDISKCYDTGRT